MTEADEAFESKKGMMIAATVAHMKDHLGFISMLHANLVADGCEQHFATIRKRLATSAAKIMTKLDPGNKGVPFKEWCQALHAVLKCTTTSSRKQSRSVSNGYACKSRA